MMSLSGNTGWMLDVGCWMLDVGIGEGGGDEYSSHRLAHPLLHSFFLHCQLLVHDFLQFLNFQPTDSVGGDEYSSHRLAHPLLHSFFLHCQLLLHDFLQFINFQPKVSTFGFVRIHTTTNTKIITNKIVDALEQLILNPAIL
jgi:hypothetical protein